MRVEEVVALFRDEARNLVLPGEVLERLRLVTRRAWVQSSQNMVTAFALDDDNLDSAIDAEIDHFQSIGQEFEWKVFSFDEPSRLLETLRKRGFRVEAEEALVIYDLEEGPWVVEQDSVCEVKLVQTDRDLVDFRTVAEAIFGKDYSFTVGQLATALEAGDLGHQGFIGYVDGQPASIGRLYSNPESRFAGFYGGGTIPTFRGLGCYRAVISARAEVAQSRGSRFLQVDALPTSLPILLRLGFTRIASTWPCIWEPKNFL